MVVAAACTKEEEEEAKAAKIVAARRRRKEGEEGSKKVPATHGRGRLCGVFKLCALINLMVGLTDSVVARPLLVFIIVFIMRRAEVTGPIGACSIMIFKIFLKKK